MRAPEEELESGPNPPMRDGGSAGDLRNRHAEKDRASSKDPCLGIVKLEKPCRYSCTIKKI